MKCLKINIQLVSIEVLDLVMKVEDSLSTIHYIISNQSLFDKDVNVCIQNDFQGRIENDLSN